MEQLTKKQRHEVYKAVLEELNRRERMETYCYLCNEIDHKTRDLYGFYPNTKDFIEFFKQKPKLEFGKIVWFLKLENGSFDFESRRKILTQCIEETKP